MKLVWHGFRDNTPDLIGARNWARNVIIANRYFRNLFWQGDDHDYFIEFNAYDGYYYIKHTERDESETKFPTYSIMTISDGYFEKKPFEEDENDSDKG